jgi:hypothetical protein
MVFEPLAKTTAVVNTPSFTGTVWVTVWPPPVTVTVTLVAVVSETVPEMVWIGVLVVLFVRGRAEAVITGTAESSVI